jgi:hypothetical protein
MIKESKMKRRNKRNIDSKSLGRQLHYNKYVKISYVDVTFYSVLLLLLPLLTELFYRQTIVYNGNYPSDTIAYVNWAIEDPGSLRAIEWVFSKLYRISESTFEIAIFMALVTVAIIIVIRIGVRYFLSRNGINANPVLIAILSLLLIFESSIYLPKIFEHFYKNAWTGFAWHSPTQRLMVLFGLVSILLFIKIYDMFFVNVEHREHSGNFVNKKMIIICIAFSICLLISAWAKPAFIMCFFPTIALMLLFKLKKHPRRVIVIACLMIPAFVYFLYLNGIMYGATESGADESSNQVAIAFGYLHMQIEKPFFTPIPGMMFPLSVLVFNFRRLKTDIVYRLSWIMFLVGLLIALTFIETGDRMYNGNFGWGFQFSLLFLFISSVAVYIGNIYGASFMQNRVFAKRNYCIIAGLLFCCHIISGLSWFYLIVYGNGYYI